MTEHVSAASRLPRNAGRALLLAGVGAGLWLLGSAHSAASAEELAPPVAPVVQQLLEPVADPVVAQVVAPVASPIAAQVLVPVVDRVVVPVVDQVVVPVVEPLVGQVMAPVVTPVLTSVVDALTPAVTPVVDSLDPLLQVTAPVGDAVVRSTVPVTQPEAPAAGVPAPGVDVAPSHARAALPVDEQAVTAPLPSPVRPAGQAPLPVPLGVPAGTPAASASAGSSSGNQTPADLASAARIVAATALTAAADDTRDAAGSTTFDPSLSPD